jgi:hypothetical protein
MLAVWFWGLGGRDLASTATHSACRLEEFRAFLGFGVVLHGLVLFSRRAGVGVALGVLWGSEKL